jgi:succinoglycan biosynthesis transport protein ExoP
VNKNFELLQQAQPGPDNGPTITNEEIGSETRTQARASLKSIAGIKPGIREESLKLVQRLFLTPVQAAPKAVMFAAIDSKNRCSWLCSIIAKLLAESVSGSVCLVEGNFRTPSLPPLMGIENHNGLADALRQDGAIRNFGKHIGPNNLWFLSSGSLGQDSLHLFNSNRMYERINELRREFDYLVIDAPPLNVYADGMALGRLLDGVVLVLEANATRREAALRITEGLRAAKIPVLGAILNNRTFPIPDALYKRL